MQATLTFDVGESEVDAFVDRLRARWPGLKIVVRSTRAIKDPEDDENFNLFWDTYPRRINRKASLRCWMARLNEGCVPEQMIKAASNYAAECAGKEDKFILHPSTFLGPNARWIEWLQVKEETPYSPF